MLPVSCRVVELVTGQERAKNSNSGRNLKNLKDTLPWGTKVEMSSEAAVIQLCHGAQGKQPEHKVGNWGCRSGSKPQERKHREGEVAVKPWASIKKRESYFHRSLRWLSRKHRGTECVVFITSEERMSPKDMGSRNVKDCYKILLISARVRLWPLPAPNQCEHGSHSVSNGSLTWRTSIQVFALNIRSAIISPSSSTPYCFFFFFFFFLLWGWECKMIENPHCLRRKMWNMKTGTVSN